MEYLKEYYKSTKKVLKNIMVENFYVLGVIFKLTTEDWKKYKELWKKFGRFQKREVQWST